MAKKRKKNTLTPLQEKVMELVKQGEPVKVSTIQRSLQCGFVKACELIKSLEEKGLLSSNVDSIMVERG